MKSELRPNISLNLVVLSTPSQLPGSGRLWGSIFEFFNIFCKKDRKGKVLDSGLAFIQREAS